MRFFSAKPEKNSLINREYPFSGFVPYLYHLDKNVVYTKKNQLVQVIKLGGFSFETADDEELATYISQLEDTQEPTEETDSIADEFERYLRRRGQ